MDFSSDVLYQYSYKAVHKASNLSYYESNGTNTNDKQVQGT